MAGVRGAYLLVAEGHARHDVLAEEYLEHGTRVRQRRFHSPLLEELQQPKTRYYVTAVTAPQLASYTGGFV